MDKIQSMFSMSDWSSVKIHIFIYAAYSAPRTTRALIGVLYATQCYHHMNPSLLPRHTNFKSASVRCQSMGKFNFDYIFMCIHNIKYRISSKKILEKFFANCVFC